MPRLPNKMVRSMTSGTRGTSYWFLRCERSLPQHFEPPMGWTADDDPIVDVELQFCSLNAAIRFAEGQGINYRVQDQHHAIESVPQHNERERKHSDGIDDAPYSGARSCRDDSRTNWQSELEIGTRQRRRRYG